MATSLSGLKARRYSAEELLHLRKHLPVVRCVVEKLNKYPDIGILRLPEEALGDPERFVCKSQILADFANRRRFAQTARKQISGGSSEESEPLVVSSVNLPRDTHRIQWQLRRREISDHSSQPHSAPSGIVAQQSENFQRFYRAVVSPTHVRVTAGGRIVPNTRPIAPPAFDWNKDNLTFAPPISQPDIEISPAQALWQQTTSQTNSFQPLLSNSFATPYIGLTRGNNLPLATMGPQFLGSTTGNAKNPLEIALPKPIGEATSRHQVDGAFLQPVKISHPSQFDHTKPFMFNGHVVYPLPPGQQPPPHALPVPYTVLGNPNFVPQQLAPPGSGFLPHQLPFPMGPLANPLPLPPMSQPTQQPLPVPIISPLIENASPLAPYFPTPGLISIAEITKYQINGLYSHLKFLDNQIANNKHQIDEDFMVHQRGEVMATIKNMETMLGTQLAHEGKVVADKHQSGGSTKNQHAEASNIIPARERESNRSSSTELSLRKEDRTAGQALFSKPKLVPVHISAPKGHINSKTQHEPTTTTKLPRNAESITQSEPIVKSKLTAAAAMAPAFQPRAKAEVAANNFNRYPSTETSFGYDERTAIAQTPDNVSPAIGATSWGQYQSSGDTSSVSQHVNGVPILRAQSMRADQSHTGEDSLRSSFESFERPQTFHGVPSALNHSSTAPRVETRGVPYLVGVLPRGMTLSEAKATDLIYSRPLTNEEVRARYLYWGKAPRVVLSGLPKFDGKDFYPASPKKEASNREAAPLTPTGEVTKLSPDLRSSYPDLTNGYKTPSPAYTGSSFQKTTTPTPTQLFMENGVHSFQSPSPRPSAYRYEASTTSGYQVMANGGSQSSYEPAPPGSHGDAPIGLDKNYYDLFLERGVPGYKSPTPPPKHASKLHNGGIEGPVTPTNRRLFVESEPEGHGSRSVNSPGAPASTNQWGYGDIEQRASVELEEDDTLSETSTVELNLVAKLKVESPKHVDANGVGERAIDFSSIEQQNMFLHNMLRNTAQVTMAAPALSGAVSSATAQGYLPQYRGAAAASLAPTALSMTTAEREGYRINAKTSQPNSPGFAPLTSANFLPENRPLNRNRSPLLARPSPKDMGAEDHTRYVIEKDKDQKIIEAGWNAKTNATGPVMGSDW